jgi:hypothetical protein
MQHNYNVNQPTGDLLLLAAHLGFPDDVGVELAMDVQTGINIEPICRR